MLCYCLTFHKCLSSHWRSFYFVFFLFEKRDFCIEWVFLLVIFIAARQLQLVKLLVWIAHTQNTSVYVFSVCERITRCANFAFLIARA